MTNVSVGTNTGTVTAAQDTTSGSGVMSNVTIDTISGTVQAASAVNLLIKAVQSGASINIGHVTSATIDGKTFRVANETVSVDGGQLNMTTSFDSLTLNGQGAGSSLTVTEALGTATSNTWNITGADAGDINGLVHFASIPNLTGGTENDTFVIQPGGSVSGVIDGGGGTNTLDYSNRSDAVTVDLPLDQASLVDGFAVNGIANIQNVSGSQGNNILVGDANANVLTAGAGRSIVIGGTGADTLTGGTHDDILVAARTSYDSDLTALNALLAEWIRTDLNYKSRVNDIMVGTQSDLNQVNGTQIILVKASANTGTVFDNTVANTIVGSPGPDLDLIYYDNSLTTLTNKLAGEKLVNLANTAGTPLSLLASSTGDSSTLPLGSMADVLSGPLFVSIQEDDGSTVPNDVQARINDSLTTWGNRFATEGLSFIIVPAGTPAADFQIHIGTTSALGGLADGVLGCTTSSGTVTLITGWNWYTGSDPTKVGANQYDFQTIVTHELGHVLGLGHSTDTASVMYPYLSAGTARRDLTANDMVTLGSDSGTGAEPLLALLEPAAQDNGHGIAVAPGHVQTGQGIPAVVPARAPDSALALEQIAPSTVENLPAAVVNVPPASSTDIGHAPVNTWFGMTLVIDPSGGNQLDEPFHWDPNSKALAGHTVPNRGAGSFDIQPGGISRPGNLVRYAAAGVDVQDHQARDWFFGAAGVMESKPVETTTDPFADLAEDWTIDLLPLEGAGSMLLAGIFAGATLEVLSRSLCEEEKPGSTKLKSGRLEVGSN
jgi:hypothetical protein